MPEREVYWDEKTALWHRPSPSTMKRFSVTTPGSSQQMPACSIVLIPVPTLQALRGNLFSN
uniref:Uncharacterized protein n=1 Tax=Magallana gigas TaxID=29159 RepID=K1QGW0_MAGGI